MVLVLLAAAIASAPPFAHGVAPVTRAQLGRAWHAGCPVAPTALRRVWLRYWGLDGRAHVGALDVNARAVAGVVAVFERLYAVRFPIRRLRPVGAYGGSDERAEAADDTSGFNCRLALAAGPPRWSMHAYGLAVDVNPVENPYLEGGRVHPAAGRAYLDRSRRRPGMATAGGVLVRAFAAIGWRWGARFGDFQHFSPTGT